MSTHSIDSDRTMVVEDETPETELRAEIVVKGRNVESSRALPHLRL